MVDTINNMNIQELSVYAHQIVTYKHFEKYLSISFRYHFETLQTDFSP